MKKRTVWIVLGIVAGLAVLCCIGFAVLSMFADDTPQTLSMEASETVADVKSTASESVEEKSEAVITEPTATETPIEPPTQEKTTGIVGEPVGAGGISITVLSVTKEKSVGTFSTASDGNTFLVAEVLISNIDLDDEAPHNPLYFKIKDSDGFEYTASIEAKNPSLKSGNLRKGEFARGFVAFEVPESATGFVLSYEPIVLFGGFEVLKVDLEKVSESLANLDLPKVSFENASSVGDRVESGGIAISLQEVKAVNSFSFSTPSEGYIFVDLDVVIENVAREADPYNPLYFQVKDENGYEFNVVMEASEPTLKSGELAKGEKVRGHVAFEVPESTRKLLVSYVPLVLLADYETVRFVVDIPAPQ